MTYLNNKKYIFLFLLLLLLLISRVLYQDKINASKKYIFDTTQTEYKVNFEIPFLKHKVRLDLLSNNKLCSNYISKNKIKIFYEESAVNIDKINLLAGGEVVPIKIYLDENLESCQFRVLFFDPYGSMWKSIILIFIPLLLISYLLLKFLVVFLKRKYYN